ncbi:Endonuclease/exonuclease/phosphatase, partial [Dichotomocladium elegans]
RWLCRCFLVCAVTTLAFFIFGYFYFRPYPLPASTVPDKTTNTTARFLTLNIFMRPPGVKNNKSDYKEDRLDYIIKYILPAYDVIVVQEAFAFANRRIDRLQVKAKEMGFNHQVASPRHYPWELAADGGLLLLSRFAIKKADVLEFPRGIHADWMSKKGALHALIELNATRSVHLYTTHTQASYNKAGAFSEQDTRVRLSQFALVHRLIRETARRDGSPILLMGDLNVDAAAHLGKATDHSVESSQAYTMMDKSWHLDTMVDAVYNQFKYHVVTFGDIFQSANGSAIPGDTVLTHSDQLMTMQSIDRIFWADRYNQDITLSNITVEKFLVEENKALRAEERQNIHFSQIS